MKKLGIITLLLLATGFGCGKDDTKPKTPLSPVIPPIVNPDEPGGTTPTSPIREATKLIISSEFKGEDAYIIFTNKDALSKKTSRIEIIDKNISLSKNVIDNQKVEVIGNRRRDLNFEKLNEEIVDLLSHAEASKEKSFNLAVNEAIDEPVGTITTFSAIEMNSLGKEVPMVKEAELVKKVTTTSGENRTLNIWKAVDDITPLTANQIEVIANGFLKEGRGNDIYEYITNAFGKEYYEAGAQHALGTIAPKGTVDIFISTINQDERSPYGVVLGYFYSGDTLTKDYVEKSNERVMFYLDSRIVRDQPNEALSTLAHEFVHVINHYQKRIVRNSNILTWLDEMLAMIGEDLVASKLGIAGPRGITDINSNNPTEEEKSNWEGRFYSYNNDVTNTLPVNVISSFEVQNYSQTFAYGAYLMRNYISSNGDLGLLHHIVDSQYGNHVAIEESLRQLGYDITFEDTVKDFAKATLLSDNIFSGDEMYKYNVGRSFEHNGTRYEVGAINVHNYVKRGIPGFVTFSTNYKGAPILNRGGVQYFKLGENLTGLKWFDIDIPKGLNYEIILKDTNGTYLKERSLELQGEVIEF